MTDGRPTARVLAIGGTAALVDGIRTVESLGGFTVVGATRAGPMAPGVVDALRPDLALVAGDVDDPELVPMLRRIADSGRHRCDVLLIVPRLRGDLLARLRELGVLSCLVEPIDTASLTRLLALWVSHWRGGAAAPDPVPDETGSTLELIGQVLRASRTSLSASEVGELCKVSAVASRRHLKQLVDDGLAMRTVEYGRAGRPRHLYRWAGAPHPGDVPGIPGPRPVEDVSDAPTGICGLR